MSETEAPLLPDATEEDYLVSRGRSKPLPSADEGLKGDECEIKKKRSRSVSSSSSLSVSSGDSSSGSSLKKKKKDKKSKKDKKKKKKKKSKKEKKLKSKKAKVTSTAASSSAPVMSESLLRKLADKNETLAERRARKERERNAQMAAKFGYTNDENPFNDPNLDSTFTWGKKVQTKRGAEVKADTAQEKRAHQEKLVDEIEKVRRRRVEREEEFEEMQRLREEESRLREASHYDDWQRKEEEVRCSEEYFPDEERSDGSRTGPTSFQAGT